MPHGEEFSNTVLVKVNGTPLPDDVKPLLVGGYVDDSNNVPDLFLLRFSDEAGIVLQKADAEIGAKVELSLQSTSPAGPAVLLAGEVTAIEVDISEAGVHTVVRGLDASHRLFRGTRVEAYVNMTASDIVMKVAQRVGLAVRRSMRRPRCSTTPPRTTSTTGTSCAGSAPSTTGCSRCPTASCTSCRARLRPRPRVAAPAPATTRSS